MLVDRVYTAPMAVVQSTPFGWNGTYLQFGSAIPGLVGLQGFNRGELLTGAHLLELSGPVMRQTGITNYRRHDNRRTYASHLVSSGLSLEIVGRLLGAYHGDDNQALRPSRGRSVACGYGPIRLKNRQLSAGDKGGQSRPFDLRARARLLVRPGLRRGSLTGGSRAPAARETTASGKEAPRSADAGQV
jgi:hypothetical protein